MGARRRRVSRRPVDWISGALGLGGLALALAGLFGPIGPLPLDRLEAAADARLQAPDPSQNDLHQAEQLTERLIARRPADASAWLRLAYIDRAQHTPLSAHAQTQVLRSYELEPLGPELTRWRLAFLFENWDALTPTLRDKAINELAAVFPRHGWALRDLPSTIQNPRGRMVAFMVFSRFRTEADLTGKTSQRSKT
jgi:hypothetical protein